MGMVSNLLRVRDGKNPEWRSRVAQLHSHGRVLPERTAADVDRLVHATSPALVSRGYCLCNAGHGTRDSLDVSTASALADCVLFYRHALGNRRHPDGKLHVLELPRPLAGHSLARRSLPSEIR